MENQNKENQVKQPVIEKTSDTRPLRVGLLLTEHNYFEIQGFINHLKWINDEYPNKVRLVIFGFKEDVPEYDFLKELDFEYVKPVSIIHYFKQLNSLNLDVLMVLLTKTMYNITSENYNKYLEAGIFKIPLFAPNQFPYSQVIRNKLNGFLYDELAKFRESFTELVNTDLMLVKKSGSDAYEDVKKNFDFNEQNARTISKNFEYNEN